MANPAALRRRRKEFEAELATRTKLARIYRNYVEPRPARQGRRNETITKMIPALFSVVSDDVAEWMCMAWFDTNSAVFKDSRGQHEKETRALLSGRAASYQRELPTATREVYDELDEREKSAFRICRALALLEESSIFFLGCDELAERIGCKSMQAYRILNGFKGDGVLLLVTPGVRRAPGVAPLATEYKWLLQ